MNTIPLFFSPYDVFSGEFQSIHFVLFRNVRLRKSYSTVRIYFIKSSGNCMLWYFNAKVSICSFRDCGCCCKSIHFFFYSLPIHLSSLAIIFLGLPSFLKILWITISDFPIVFEISPIESLSSLHNLTISFLSSNDVRDFFAMFTMQEPIQNRCNLVKYPILYS